MPKKTRRAAEPVQGAALEEAEKRAESRRRLADVEHYISDLRLWGRRDEIEALTPELRSLVEQPPSLLDRVGKAVIWGLDRGYVHLDGRSGLAYAARPAHAAADAGTPEDAVPAAIPGASGCSDEERAQFARELVAGLRSERDGYRDLKYALTLGEGQRVALSGLRVERAAASEMDHIIAGEISTGIALLASTTDGAPARVYHALRPMLEFWQNASEGLTIPVWFRVLRWYFDRPLVGTNEREVVVRLLDAVCFHDRCAPVAFHRRESRHIRLAEHFVRTERIATSSVYDDPVRIYDAGHAKRRGPAMTSWRAAVKFARKFGVSTPPEREKDAKRRKLPSK